MDLNGHLGQSAPATTSEALYERLAGYGFARRYVADKTVADIGREDLGLGSRLLAETAASVTGLTGSPEAVALAASAYPAPNVDYKSADLPELPYPEDHLDVVVALGALEDLERPEALVAEARRVLRGDGVLVVSVRDRRALVGGRGGMYVPDLRELLEGHFGRVGLYRQGAVVGGFVFPETGETTGTLVEGASLSLTDPRVGAEPPTTRSVLAVCGAAETGAETPGREAYLLLDRDRRIYDEVEDRAEDVGLLREEIRQMQETEAQAFQDALRLRGTEIGYLRAQLRRQGAQMRAIEDSTTWRLFEPYRRLRAKAGAVKTKVDAVRKRTSGGAG